MLMKKVFVSVNECTPGMRMAETIFNDYGAAIVAEDTILDEHIIAKISRLGIVKIKIYESEDSIVTVKNTELFSDQYYESVDIMKDVIHSISTGGKVDIESVSIATNNIISRINENRDIINSINQIKTTDEYTYTHSVNVSLLCMLFGKWLKYDFFKVRDLVYTGLLHDIGKGKIDPEILNKKEALNGEEFEEIKKHPLYSYQLAEEMTGLNDNILKGILMHHEKEDGTGYPLGIKGDQINEFAKIVSICDIYDAMTSNRSYRKKGSPFEVFEIFEKESYGLLDQRLVSVFLKNMSAYYIGDFVRMNSGEIGEIIYINPTVVSKPIIRVNERFIDLSREKNSKIMELI
jgi:HD-GYP domain-containing protein (c-di-GMP phosphodiesterase class II)